MWSGGILSAHKKHNDMLALTRAHKRIYSSHFHDYTCIYIFASSCPLIFCMMICHSAWCTLADHNRLIYRCIMTASVKKAEPLFPMAYQWWMKKTGCCWGVFRQDTTINLYIMWQSKHEPMADLLLLLVHLLTMMDFACHTVLCTCLTSLSSDTMTSANISWNLSWHNVSWV